MRAEVNLRSIELVFVWVVVVEVDSVFRCGPQIAWFSIDIDLIFVWVVDIDLISVWEIEIDFKLGIGIVFLLFGGRK